MAQVSLQLREADGHLPPVCMCCGEPASADKIRSMTWTPPWVGILILTGLIPYVIVASILTKRTTVQVPLCEQHQGHWLKRNLLIWGSFFLFGFIGVAGIVLAANLPNAIADTVFPFVCVVGMLLLVIWLVIVIWCQNTAIRPKEITDYEITLTGVCDAFIDAVDDARAARRARRRERENREYDEDNEELDAPRRRRKPPSDAIEE